MTQRHLLPIGGPIASDILLATLAAHAIPGAETQNRPTHRRLISTDPGIHHITVEIHNDAVLLTCEAEDPVTVADLVTAVRSWLDLNTDLTDMTARFGADPLLAPLVEAHPGLRIPSYPNGFEAMIMTVIGQQISLAAGRTFGGRLVAHYGSDRTSGLTAFPTTPERLADTTVEGLRAAVGITNARARTVIACAQAFLTGLTLPRSHPTTAQRSRLLAIPGVGPWTADFLAVRAMADPDAFAPGDLILRRALDGIPARDASIVAEKWRPWRAYALSYLWASTLIPNQRKNS
jgi:3-methyladenine DNA glycosylase/8-oxoguanine DNA glycosylase